MKRCMRRFSKLLWLLSCLYLTGAHATGWLTTSGNHIINADTSVWVGHGANLHDTRSCGGGTLPDGTPINDNATGVAEVKRRIDTLVDTWHATFIRLALETDGAAGAGNSYVESATYRQNVIDIVNYIGTKPGVYVLVAIWQDPSLDANGWPTAGTNAILAQLATDFYTSPHVLYGVSNEPQSNFDGAQDATVWTAMNSAVSAIRTAEAAIGPNRHIVTVQGTRDWARDVSYYLAHPITAGGGVNIAYETHVYNSPADFTSMLATPAATIPVVAGEFGPINDAWHAATVPDMQTLIDMANANNIPHLAWTFHQYCPPNLIADTPGKTWDTNSTPADWHGMPIYPTDFGQLLINNWAPAGPALLNTSFPYNTTSTNDNVTRASTAQVTRLNNFGAEKRPVVVLMPGWGGVGDVPAVQDAQAIMFANQGYVAVNVGFHETGSAPGGGLADWYSDLSEGVMAALNALCLQTYADCSAVVLVGESFGGTQIHPVVRYLRGNNVFDGSGGANGGRKVVGLLGQDSGYTLSWDPAAPNADATAYSISLIQNLGDTTFPTDICDGSGNCGARNRADYHQSAAGSQYVLSYCPAGGEHGTRGYGNWDAWVLSAVKTMLHNQRGVVKFTGYVEPTIAVSNVCVTAAPTTYAVNISRTGSGTVTSNPAGINCGANCSANFNGGSSVTLTAAPAPGYTFSSWSGFAGCTNVSPCTFNMPAAVVNMVANFVVTPTAPVVSLNPVTLLFANQNVGTTSAGQTVTLTNSGDATLNIGSIAASGDFAKTSTCGATLAAAANCTISVTFTPTAAGGRAGSVVIASDAASSPDSVSLSGTGVAVPAVSLNPTSLTFTNQVVNTTSAARNVTLTNTGGAALNISSIASNNTVFGVTNNCGSGLAASGFCTLSVTFSPSTPVSTLSSVTVSSNAAGSPHAVVVSGSGVPAGAPVCTLTANPATVAPNGTSVLSSNCTNSPSSYSWTGGTCAGTTAATCTVTPAVTTTYSVTGTNGAGSGTGSATVTVSTGDAFIPIMQLLLLD